MRNLLFAFGLVLASLSLEACELETPIPLPSPDEGPVVFQNFEIDQPELYSATKLVFEYVKGGLNPKQEKNAIAARLEGDNWSMGPVSSYPRNVRLDRWKYELEAVDLGHVVIGFEGMFAKDASVIMVNEGMIIAISVKSFRPSVQEVCVTKIIN